MRRSDIYLEEKSRKSLDGFINCACGRGATELVEIGLMEMPHGSFFDICNDMDCLERAFETAERRYLNAQTYADSRYDIFKRAV